MATTYDIAERAGVDQSTVSRALSKSPLVSRSTASKVRHACRELNYVPNTLARALRSNRTHAIAIHIPLVAETVFADPFIPEFLAGVGREGSCSTRLDMAVGEDRCFG